MTRINIRSTMGRPNSTCNVPLFRSSANPMAFPLFSIYLLGCGLFGGTLKGIDFECLHLPYHSDSLWSLPALFILFFAWHAACGHHNACGFSDILQFGISAAWSRCLSAFEVWQDTVEELVNVINPLSTVMASNLLAVASHLLRVETTMVIKGRDEKVEG